MNGVTEIVTAAQQLITRAMDGLSWAGILGITFIATTFYLKARRPGRTPRTLSGVGGRRCGS